MQRAQAGFVAGGAKSTTRHMYVQSLIGFSTWLKKDSVDKPAMAGRLFAADLDL